MIACLDVDYRAGHAMAGAVLLDDWQDDAPAHEVVARIDGVAEYCPGEFYQRELPCLHGVLQAIGEAIVEAIVVDGYVWLDGQQERPGLGARLYQSLAKPVAVIGVAKTHFHAASCAKEVIRGDSHRPLFVTAVGMPTEVAATHIKKMHGEFRLPTMLKRVDRLCRDAL